MTRDQDLGANGSLQPGALMGMPKVSHPPRAHLDRPARRRPPRHSSKSVRFTNPKAAVAFSSSCYRAFEERTKTSSNSNLPRKFYARDTVSVARDLLGCVLETRIRGAVTAGRIVEVEAYVGPHDPASHGANWRRTARTEPMYGAPGSAYVYRSYGVHWCFNVVTERDDYPAAVLVRALEPLRGMKVMSRRRSQDDLRLLCSGPGRLTQALGITAALNRARLDGVRIRIKPGTLLSEEDLGSGPRVGISRAADWPLRFFVEGSRWLSRRG